MTVSVLFRSKQLGLSAEAADGLSPSSPIPTSDSVDGADMLLSIAITSAARVLKLYLQISIPSSFQDDTFVLLSYFFSQLAEPT